MTITEKTAFLKGLAEGSDLKLGDKEQKVFDTMLEILEDLANSVASNAADIDQIYDEVDEIYDEIDDVNDCIDAILDDEDDEDECDCEECHGHHHDDEVPMYEITCDKCGAEICVDEDAIFDGDLKCPNCGEPIEIELDFDCDCGDEDCDCKK